MSLDCEFNQPSKKTIQIGAAAYDVRTGALIDTLDIYVDPGEPITEFITELTGITDQDVKGAPTIQEAFQLLKEFHEKHKVFMNPIVWGSGVSNDSLALYQEAKPNEPNFMGYRVVDAKVLYQSLRMFQNKQIKGGLETACGTKGINIGWDMMFGKNHRALADAHNTFRLWHYMTIRLKNGFKDNS